MEIDGIFSEIGSDNVALSIRRRDNGDLNIVKQIQNMVEGNGGDKYGVDEVVTVDTKRKRAEGILRTEESGNDIVDLENKIDNGPKNGLVADLDSRPARDYESNILELSWAGQPTGSSFPEGNKSTV